MRGGAVSITSRETMADVLQVRLLVCVDVAECLNTRKTVEHFHRMELQSLKALGGSVLGRMNGFARFGKVHTGIGPIKRHGFIMLVKMLHMSCDGIVQKELTK